LRIREEIVQATKIAFAYIGTVVGAGFASGQEIMRFFTVYGIYSIWPILIAASLFIFIGTKILRLGSKLNSQSYKAIIETYLWYHFSFCQWIHSTGHGVNRRCYAGRFRSIVQ
jgi:uncharacterized membrane protein YkvI